MIKNGNADQFNLLSSASYKKFLRLAASRSLAQPYVMTIYHRRQYVTYVY